MIKVALALLGIGCLSAISCGSSKTRTDIRHEIEPHLVVGETTRNEVVALMREKKYQVIDEPNLPNMFDDGNCEYMPASYVEENFFGRYITVIDFCFNREPLILEAFKVNETAGSHMLFP